MSVICIPVDFGGVSIGDQTVRIGITVARAHIDLLKADEVFVCHRLTGTVTLGRRDDQDGQAKLFDSDVQIQGVFDCKRIGVNGKNISTGLAFSLEDIDISELARFSKGAGMLEVESVAELPDSDQGNGDLGDDVTVQTEAPSTLKLQGAVRDVPLAAYVSEKYVKKLAASGFRTVGQLGDYTASERRLTDLAGIGPVAAAAIEEELLRVWRDYPQGA